MEFTGQLYDFQKDVLNWANTNDRGIIGLDMGLGKTVITIALLCQKKYQRTLVLVPLPIIEQWKASVLKFSNLKDSDVCIYQGASRKKKNLADYKVVITTYDVVRIDMNDENSYLARGRSLFDCLVLDEAHRIRNRKTCTYAACEDFGEKITSKWLLTGTAIHNKFDDFYNLCRFIKIPYLTKIMIAREEVRDKWYIRLMKSQCNIQLPEKTIHTPLVLHFDSIHQGEYNDLFEETKKLYDEYVADGSRSAFTGLLSKILRLRQCCNHPDAILDSKTFNLLQNRHLEASSSKFNKAIEIVKKTPVDDKIIIFSQWERSLQIFGFQLEKQNIKYLEYNGSLDARQRSQVLNRFRTSDIQVILITIQSGGVGLDLNFANNVIILDSWWNSALEEQAIDRVYRIGQKKPVEVYQIYMMNSIEDWMRQLKSEKSMVASQFHEEGSIYEPNREMLSKLLHRYI